MVNFSVPLAGMTQATNQVNQTAAKLAKSGFSGSGNDTVDLSSDMVSLMQARISFQANADTLQTEGQLSKSLLNAVG
jgi:flagellar hook protein FlgE